MSGARVSSSRVTPFRLPGVSVSSVSSDPRLEHGGKEVKEAMFTDVLESERRARGMTQRQLAAKVGLAERTYRGVVCRESRLHPETQSIIARTLRSPRLAAAALAELPNPFAPVLLDVDNHPAQQFLRALAELREAMEAIERVEIVGKPTREQVEYALDQSLDLLHLIPALCDSWCRAYGVDLWAVRARNLEKLRARGYVSEEREAA
jgi:transcriptional regulator with XRE-family HTH domain